MAGGRQGAGGGPALPPVSSAPAPAGEAAGPGPHPPSPLGKASTEGASEAVDDGGVEVEWREVGEFGDDEEQGGVA